MDGAAIKVCLKADGSIVPCATDLSVVIAATLELIIAHIEKAGKDGALNGDDKLAAALGERKERKITYAQFRSTPIYSDKVPIYIKKRTSKKR